MTANGQVEVESKFTVGESTPVPTFEQVPAVTSVDEEQVHHLSAVYYDTADLRLTRSRITLRRRTGGTDEGWHIKLPGTAGRKEVQAPLDAGDVSDSGRIRVPRELLAEIRSIVRAAPLVPIAQVDNERHVRTIHTLVDRSILPTGSDDAAGNDSAEGAAELDNAQVDIVGAEFCDDHVTSWGLLPGGTKQQWREWEIELSAELSQDLSPSAAGPVLLSQLSQFVVSRGARLSSSPSKLVMALGDTLKQTVPSEDQLAEGSAAAIVVNALREGRDRLIALDPEVRRDEWDSVHQMRVTTREMRSQLQTFEGILEPEAITSIENRLRELAARLGTARDAEVVRDRFIAVLQTPRAYDVNEETREHLVTSLRQRYVDAHASVVAALESKPYWRLLDDIDELIAHPPLAAEHRAAVAGAGAEGAAEAGSAARSESAGEAGGAGSTGGSVGKETAETAGAGGNLVEGSEPQEVQGPEVAERLEGEFGSESESESESEGDGEKAGKDKKRGKDKEDKEDKKAKKDKKREKEEKKKKSSKDEPELTAEEQAALDDQQVLLDHLSDAWEHLQKRHEKAIAGSMDTTKNLDEQEALFHNVRKSAKRLRYAAAAVGTAGGLKTRKLVSACKALQSCLGDAQDTATARATLRELAADAHAQGQDTFGYGVLHQCEREDGQRALEDYDEIFDQVHKSYKKLMKHYKK